MATPSERLRITTDLMSRAFETPGRLLLESSRARELYPSYLAAGTCVALEMIPLMEAALERARALASDDPVAAGLAAYLERHIPEEIHGDEPGGDSLEDLEVLGVDTAALRSPPLPPKIAAVIGMQYFWIHQCHPAAILGFLELEAYHPHAPAVEQLIATTGLPRDGFRQLLLHSELDVEHADELHRVLDSLPLEPHHEQLIASSALQTMALMIDVWLDVISNGAPAASSDDG